MTLTVLHLDGVPIDGNTLSAEQKMGLSDVSPCFSVMSLLLSFLLQKMVFVSRDGLVDSPT